MSISNLKFTTGKNSSPISKRRVFCAFHPKNRQTANEIIQDIISACECTVFYYEGGDGPTKDEVIENDLSHMALMVLIVSADFLTTPSFAYDVAYNFATTHTIPILPIMIENGIEDIFNKKMGNLQYLMRNTEKFDATAIPYSEKLSNYLSDILVSDNDVRRLRAAFDTSIFLSYRKKDRHFAQSLMEMIHNNEVCRSIAIWYDEFLTPGEDFNDGIMTELSESSAVILVVTPSIVEKDNYITLIEYPTAVSIGKSVLPFEMATTDRTALAEAYPGLSVPISTVDAAEVRNAILKIIKQQGVKILENSEEKEFLRGLSYLKGIYVEKNTTFGVNMILNAANKGVEEAISATVQMYRNGEGVQLSLQKAKEWQEKYIDIKSKICDGNPSDENIKSLLKAYFELCSIYEQGGQNQHATDTYSLIINLLRNPIIKNRHFTDEFLAIALESRGIILAKQGNYSAARYDCFEPTLDIRKKQYEATNTMLAKLKLTEMYAKIAECCENCQDIVGIKTNVINMEKLLPSPTDFENMPTANYDLTKRFLICNNKLGHLYGFTEKWNERFLCVGNSVLIAEKLINISDTYDSRRQLILALMNDGDQHSYQKVENHLNVAEAAYDRAYAEAITLSITDEPTAELKRDIAGILQRKAHIKAELGDIKQAILIYNEAVEKFKELNDILSSLPSKKELLDCMYQTALVYEQADNSENSEKFLKECLELAEQAIEHSELAVYKKDKAGSLELLANIYKKQWDMDQAFAYRKEQCLLLRQVCEGTGRAEDIKLFASALKEAVAVAKLAGEFEESRILTDELSALINKYKILFNNI